MTQSTPTSESASSTTDTLMRLAAIIDSRKGGDPDVSYVSRLFHKGDDAILKKIGEEATEVVLAAKDTRHGGAPKELVGEVADLWFHCLVMLSHFELSRRTCSPNSSAAKACRASRKRRCAKAASASRTATECRERRLALNWRATALIWH